jgi:NADH dehydrogenase
MKNKNILVFGSTGFIGRSLTKRLLQNGDKLICPVRNASRVKRNILSGDIGQIDVIEFDIHNLEEIKTLIANSDLVINLIGILYEKNNLSFELVHYLLPKKIANYCELYKKPFLHVSGLGSTFQTKSNYLISKKMGEEFIENNNTNHIIVRPSTVYGEEDNFFNLFGKMAKILPFLPLIKNGMTKFQPIYVNDLSLLIFNLLNNFENHKNSNIAAVGNEIFTFKEILSHIFFSLKKKERFFYIPSFLAIIQGKVLEKLPKPLFTYDQYVTLSHDSISEGSQKLVTEILKQDLSDMKVITSEYLKKFIDKV